MSKIKLTKRSENVNYIYDNEGEKTPNLTSVEYKIIDEETGNEVGSANVYTNSLNVNIYGGINSIESAQKAVETMFGLISE